MKLHDKFQQKNSITLLDAYGLRKKIIACVKDEGGKLECNDNGIKICGWL
jgi:hypothetical protein